MPKPRVPPDAVQQPQLLFQERSSTAGAFTSQIKLFATVVLTLTTFWYAFETFRLRQQVASQAAEAGRQNQLTANSLEQQKKQVELMSNSIEQQRKQTAELVEQRKLLEQQVSLANSEHWNALAPLIFPQFADRNEIIKYETVQKNLDAAQLKDVRTVKTPDLVAYLLQNYSACWVQLYNRVPRIALDLTVIVHDAGYRTFWIADRMVNSLDKEIGATVPPFGTRKEKEEVSEQIVANYGARFAKTVQYLLRDSNTSYILVFYRNFETTPFGVRREYSIDDKGTITYYVQQAPLCLNCDPPAEKH